MAGFHGNQNVFPIASWFPWQPGYNLEVDLSGHGNFCDFELLMISPGQIVHWFPW